MEETKTCSECGRELSVGDFRTTRWGNRANVCRECMRNKAAETHQSKRLAAMHTVKQASFSDPEFDSLSPGDVWRKMCRGKRWLESRGYDIKLEGKYREVKIRKLKYE